MAGGTFDKLVGKVRPGTYINFESARKDVLGGGERGICVVPLTGHDYGPVGEFIMLTAAAPDAEIKKLGYSIYAEDAGDQMLLIREAFKRAAVVYVYNPATAGTKASGSSDGITAAAAYAGTRGNKLTYTVVENAIDGYDVEVFLDGESVGLLEGAADKDAVAAWDNGYIVFTAATGSLDETAGVTLTGGTNGNVAALGVSTFLDALEGIKFNAVAFPFSDSSMIAALKTKIKYIRENVGKGVQAVVANVAGCDYEGIINVTNGVFLDKKAVTAAQATAWVAGATAAAKNVESLTYVMYDGATGVNGVKSHEQAVSAINAGELFFSVSEAGAVVVEYDINSLVSFTGRKDKTYRKNRVIRVFDTFAEAVQLNFPPNKYNNNPDGWEIMEGIGRTILKQFEDAGAIYNVDYDADFTVDTSLSTGDETYFNVGLQATDSAEKLYFTVQTR